MDTNYQVLPLKKVKIEDKFWSKYIKLIENIVIPYQWQALNDQVDGAEPSHCIENFKIAAGIAQGSFGGFVFQDTDIAKWLEAVAYMLETHPNDNWEKIADEAIELIEKAQQQNGYLNTYFTIKEPESKWTNLRECHELYTAGHLIEAATAYYSATGKRKILDVACRLANHIDAVFGIEPEKLHGYDGHQEIELALIKLFDVTGETRYLNLSKYFIDERGKEPHYFDLESEKRGHTKHFDGNFMYEKTYNQTHLPVREQTEAVGHAVRAVYMYTAMADLANRTDDHELFEACKRLWHNIVSKKLYITGGIGSTSHGEAFTFDYDLPNDTTYSETCASIGLIFFANRMLKIEANSEYADVMERALYNTVLSGMSMDGNSFFYVNPLEVWPEASEKSPIKKHVKAVRQKWFSCACCPPNVARLLMSLGEYIYTVSESKIYTHLYISGKADFEIEGVRVGLSQESNYPWEGKIKIKVALEEKKHFTLALRIPGWCKEHTLKVNSEEVQIEVVSGYATIHREWAQDDCIDLELSMPIELMAANPKVRENAGKIAIQRGPLVYCLEEVDNGENLSSFALIKDFEMVSNYEECLLGKIVTIKGKALKTDETGWGMQLYDSCRLQEIPMEIKAIPYCMWGNRIQGEMLCWLRLK